MDERGIAGERERYPLQHLVGFFVEILYSRLECRRRRDVHSDIVMAASENICILVCEVSAVSGFVMRKLGGCPDVPADSVSS